MSWKCYAFEKLREIKSATFFSNTQIHHNEKKEKWWLYESRIEVQIFIKISVRITLHK